MGTNSPVRALAEIRRNSGVPLHTQLESALREAIRGKLLPPGTRVPPTRQLAADLGITRRVVSDAYEQLVAEGYLVSRTGAGTWVADRVAPPAPTRPATTLDAATPPTFDLRPGLPDLSVFPRAAWVAAFRRVLRQRPHADFGYGEPAGHHDVRTTLAGWLTRTRAALATPDALVLTSGTAQTMALTARVLARRGITTLAVEDPGHPEQRSALEQLGFTLEPIPVDAQGIDVDALAASGARAVLVTPAHQFPTGVVLSPQRRAALLAWAKDRPGLVIEDDYDAEYRYDRAPVGCLHGLDPDVVLYAGSASKILAPALRLGWLVAPPQLRDAFVADKIAADRGTPVLDQLALADLIDSGGLDRHLRRSRQRYRARRDQLVTALTRQMPGVAVSGVAAGLHLVAELPAGHDEAALQARAAARGVAVNGMRHYRVTTSGTPSLVIGYTRLPERQIEPAVQLLAAAARRTERG